MSAHAMKVRDFLEHLTIFGLLSALVLPEVTLLGYGVYLVTLVSPVLLIIFLMVSKGRIYRSRGLTAVALICVLVLVSTFNSYVRLGVPHDSSDIMEVIKYLQFIPYILIIQFFDAESFEKKSHKYFVLAAALFVLVGLLQTFGPESIVSALGVAYGSATQQQTLLSGERIFATGSDPNLGGAIALIFAAYNFFAFIDNRKIFHLLLAALALYLLLRTQSRTVLLGLAFAAVIYGLLISKASMVTRLGAVSFILILLFVSVAYFNLDYVILGFKYVEAGHNSSLDTRLDNLQQSYIWFTQSMLLGWGPAKAIHPTIVDSEYALILERYGICGILAFALYIFHHFKISIKAMRIVAGGWVFGRLSVFYMLFGVIFMTTNNIFSGYQLMAMIIFMLCIVTARVRQQVWLHSFACGTDSLKGRAMVLSAVTRG